MNNEYTIWTNKDGLSHQETPLGEEGSLYHIEPSPKSPAEHSGVLGLYTSATVPDLIGELCSLLYFKCSGLYLTLGNHPEYLSPNPR